MWEIVAVWWLAVLVTGLVQASSPALDIHGTQVASLKEGRVFAVACTLVSPSEDICRLLVTSQWHAEITIDVPGLNLTVETSVDPGQIYQHDIPAHFRTEGGVENKGILVTSAEADISVYVYNFGSNRSGDAIKANVVTPYSTEYVTVSFLADARAMFTFVAVEDDTLLTGYSFSGLLISQKLNAHETYTMRNDLIDLSGYFFNSTKPIAAYGSAPCAILSSRCDALMLAVPPVAFLGTFHYVPAPPVLDDVEEYTVRVLAAQAGMVTEVKYWETGNWQITGNILLHEYIDIDFFSDTHILIKCSHPCLVVQVNKVESSQGHLEPFARTISDVGHYLQTSRTDFITHNPSNSSDMTHSVTFIAKSINDNILLDNKEVSSFYIEFELDDYLIGVIPDIGTGYHTIEHLYTASSLAVWVSGHNDQSAYSYSATHSGVTLCEASLCYNGGRCKPTYPDLSCTCPPGFTGPRCQHDIDECASGSTACQQVCVNSPGSFHCACLEGFHLADDQVTCADQDECSNNPCSKDSTCINSLGSYVCACVEGYVISKDSLCEDIDECSLANVSCSHQCVNNIGSYECSCLAGFHIDDSGIKCTDVDECEEYNGGCEYNCQNSHGSFYCTCPTSHILHQNGLKCLELRHTFSVHIQLVDRHNNTKPTNVDLIPFLDKMSKQIKLFEKHPIVRTDISVRKSSEAEVVMRFLSALSREEEAEVWDFLVSLMNTTDTIELLADLDVSLQMLPTFSHDAPRHKGVTSSCQLFDDIGYCINSLGCVESRGIPSCVCEAGYGGARCSEVVDSLSVIELSLALSCAVLAVSLIILIIIVSMLKTKLDRIADKLRYPSTRDDFPNFHTRLTSPSGLSRHSGTTAESFLFPNITELWQDKRYRKFRAHSSRRPSSQWAED